MQLRFKIHCYCRVVGILVLAVGALVSTTLGEEFRVDIPTLERDYAYGQSCGPIPFNLGCCLASVTSVRVEITGWYSMGWWDGADIEDHYHGPRGSGAWFELNHDANWDLRWSWYAGVDFDTNGMFNRTNTFQPWRAPGNWDFLLDGAADLYVRHSFVVSFPEGGMTIPPHLTLSSLTVVVQGERLLRILSFSREGTLSWTPMPTPGVIRIYSASELAGPWLLVATTASSNTCCNVGPPSARSTGYFRAVYSDE